MGENTWKINKDLGIHETKNWKDAREKNGVSMVYMIW